VSQLWGERNAVTGYYPPYRVSAALVIRVLRERNLSWIAIADPKAGQGRDRTFLYQSILDLLAFVRWRDYGAMAC
jgi:hypothetical protein